jgi:hypothetical protein
MHEKIANVEGGVARYQAGFQSETRKIVGTDWPGLGLTGPGFFRARASFRCVFLVLSLSHLRSLAWHRIRWSVLAKQSESVFSQYDSSVTSSQDSARSIVTATTKS